MGRHRLISRPHRWSVLMLLVVLTATAAARADAQTYLEDFTTTTFKDPTTTAWWDTGSGELKLHPFETIPLGSIDTPGNALDVALAGDIAYVADGTFGLRVIDVSNPAAPVQLSANNPPSGSAWGIAVDGDWAYMTIDNELHSIDISNPSATVFVDVVTLNGTLFGLDVQGDHVYVAGGTYGLLVFDVSDPANITWEGQSDTPGSAIDVEALGRYAYVADRSGGLQIVDILYPTGPLPIGGYDSPGDAWGIAVSGNYAYLGDGGQGLQVIDISNPAGPWLRGHCSTGGSARGVALQGDFVYVANYGNVAVVDASDPVNPHLLGTQAMPGIASNLVPAGLTLFVADGAAGGLRTCTIAEIPGFDVLEWIGTYGTGTSMVVYGDFGFIGSSDESLQLVDLRDPEHPVWVRRFTDYPTPRTLSIDGSLLCLSQPNQPLKILNVSNPNVPSSYATGTTSLNYCTAIKLVGRTIFAAGKMATGEEGFLVFDSAFGSIQLLGYYPQPVSTSDRSAIEIHGDIAYFLCQSPGSNDHLFALDISDRANPTYLAKALIPVPRCLAVDGSHVYVGADDYGGVGEHLRVYDVSDPTADPIPYVADPGVYARFGDIEIHGDIAVLTLFETICLMDVSDPANPILLAHYHPWGMQPVDAHVYGDYVHVLGSDSRLWPIVVFQRRFDRTRNLGVSTVFATTQGPVLQYALSTIREGDLSIDISADAGANWQQALMDGGWHPVEDPGTQLRWRSTHHYSSPAVNTICRQLQLWWVEGSTGLAEVPVNLRLSVSNPHPNPSSAGVIFEYDAPPKAAVRLRVFDVTGRLVRALEAPVDAPAGLKRTVWDGRDGAGRMVPAGHYFLEAADGHEKITRRFTITR